MKIRVRRKYTRQLTATKVLTIEPGIYSVPKEVSEEDAERIRRMRLGTIVQGKRAPRNKQATVSENKSGVGKKTKRRRGARAKPNS